MKIEICQICRLDLYGNKKLSSKNFWESYLAHFGYYKIRLPKIKAVERGMGRNSSYWIDVCPNCFNKMVDTIRRKE